MPRKKKEETPAESPRSVSKAKPKAATQAAQKPAKKEKASPAFKPSKTPAVKKAPVRATADKPSPVSESLPKKLSRHGETQMVAFIRDPQCIFTYWEVTPDRIEAVKQQLEEEYKGSSMVLRLFKTGPDGKAELIQEILVEPGEMNRYVELSEKSGNYFVEIAQKAHSGRVVVYARSNNIVTGAPSQSPSSSPVPANSNSKWETPEGFFEYFLEGDETEVSQAIPGISSAEAHRKGLERKKMDRYSASRIS
jgi:hypothetical protein